MTGGGRAGAGGVSERPDDDAPLAADAGRPARARRTVGAARRATCAAAASSRRC